MSIPQGHWAYELQKYRQTSPLTAAEYELLDEDFCRTVEVVDGYTSPYLIDAECGHVWTHGLGEQRRYPIQHTLRYQIWELDQPHYLHAHGRSLTGHGPNVEEREHLAAIRKRFTAATRFDEDD